jgi:hypothetical protein
MKIDRGVPITSASSTRSGKWKDLLLDMEIGDSVLVDTKTETMTIRAAAKGLGMKVTVRGDDNKFRVWRIEV